MFPSKVSCYSNSTSTTSTATTAPGHYHDHHHHSPPADADNEHIRSHHFSTITSNGLPTDSGTLGPSLRRRRPEPPAVTVDSPPQTPPTSESAPYRQPRWSIPVPTPFEYEDCDEDDFRGYFDFDKAWVGAPATTTTTTTTTLLPPPSSGNTTFSALIPMNSRPPRRSSHPHPYRLQPTLLPLKISHSSASYGLPPTPQNDQEYYDIMYKLDLGVESPYLGTSYQESFPASVLEEPDQKRGNVGRCDNEPEVGDKQVDCALWYVSLSLHSHLVAQSAATDFFVVNMSQK
ncbi:hypothetical protein AX15_003853 [Amanita polypyramis BW_CC]|nr:hypothetical protein AX15_003853 [Amanita polypyramis BW_CC]